MDKFNEVLKFCKDYATKAGYKLNPNEKIVENIVKGLIRNEEKIGIKHCPCKLPTGDKEQDKLFECPCCEHKEDIENMDHCKCFLFFKNN